MPIIIDTNRCPQNYFCPLVSKCPKGAFSQKRFKLPLIDHKKCILCDICIKECIKGAIRYVE